MKQKIKWKKTSIILAAVIVLGVAGGYTYYRVHKGKSSTSSTLVEATVTRGDIAQTISGSAPVEPKEQYTVVPTVTGNIVKDYFEEGQQINQGDLLYSIDPTNAQNSIQQAQNTLQKDALSSKQSQETLADLNIKSNVNGLVTKVYVTNGQQVSANASIADVEDISSLTLTLPFLASDAQQIYKGQDAQVTLEDSGDVISGTVSSIYSGQQISSGGALVTNVEITFSNPGTVQAGEKATAIVGGVYACNGPGETAYSTTATIIAKTSGEVSKLSIRAGDEVSSGDTIAVLINDSTVVSAQNSALSVQSAQISLQNAQNQLTNYNITSPISGKVLEKDSKAGDTIASTSSSTTMAVIADMSSLVLTINVDELDILNVKIGQSATITADAIPGTTYTGTVDKISTLGTTGSSTSSSSSSGVTTYAVEISIPDYGSLLPGMNVNANIIVKSSQNALEIPTAAVTRGNYVLVKTSGSDKQASESPAASGKKEAVSPSAASGQTKGASAASGAQSNFLKSAPAGYKYVKITVGIVNSDYTEVTAGLNEGDTIAYTVPVAAATSSSAASSSSGRTGFSMLGGGGGGGVARQNSGGQGYSGARTSGSTSSGNRTSGGASSGQSSSRQG